MDRPGRVIDVLDRRLPRQGLVVDIGAGDGYSAARLDAPARRVIPVEPAEGMIRESSATGLSWVQADAERLPFPDGTFEAAYATWAYFFSRGWDPNPGIAELHRTVKADGPLLVVDNLGSDELTALAPTDITADVAFWSERGFDCLPVETRFEFDNISEARRLLGFYFGEAGEQCTTRSLSYRVGVFHSASRGSGR